MVPGPGLLRGADSRRQARPPGSRAARDRAGLAGRGAPQDAGPGGRGGAGRRGARGAGNAETRAAERSRPPRGLLPGRPQTSSGCGARMEVGAGAVPAPGASARASGCLRSGRRGARGAGRGCAAARSRVSRQGPGCLRAAEVLPFAAGSAPPPPCLQGRPQPVQGSNRDPEYFQSPGSSGGSKTAVRPLGSRLMQTIVGRPPAARAAPPGPREFARPRVFWDMRRF